MSRLAAKLSTQDKELLDNPSRMAPFLTGDFLKLADQDQIDFLRRTHRRSHFFRSFFRDAMRRSAGLISESEFYTTMLQIFPQFSLDEKILFTRLCRSSARPSAQKKNRLALLCAWLEHNSPVFSEFGWYREALYAAAIDRLGEKHLPKDGALMFEYCSRTKPRVCLNLKTAPPKDRAALLARPHKELLETPALNLR